MSPPENSSHTPLLSEEELSALIEGYNSRGSTHSKSSHVWGWWALSFVMTMGAAWLWWA